MPGLNTRLLDTVDPERLISRIRADIRTDFILSPHLSSVFVHARNELWDQTQDKLSGGSYEPDLPLTISVPKENGFYRPGSILLPEDRVVYQLLVDESIDALEEQLDRDRTFSHLPINNEDEIFASSHDGWERYQAKIIQMCGDYGFMVKADIANYFERIPQHHLINLMNSSGCNTSATNLLKEVLLAFQERDSFGIIQGVYPSDVLGNYYLSEFDAYCELNEIPSARYVDDIFMAFETEREAKLGMVNLVDHLRREGLHLNEHKSGVRTSASVIREESAIEELFEAAREEARESLDDYIESGYGFTAEWGDEEPEEVDIELLATEILYDAKVDYPKYGDRIERFCLPLLRSIGSDYAIEDVLTLLADKQHLTRIYHSYLSRFTPSTPELVRELVSILADDLLVTDFEKMYLLGSLFNAAEIPRRACNKALHWLQSREITQETRALSAIFVAKHGTANQKRAVRLAYENEPSAYARSAMLYASKYFTTAEKRTCRRAWGGDIAS